ncbi:Lysosomal alpha-glucosidase [Daphnia magna]|uniref:Lysosomal alpha-glucosidase n=1 Tax=Daphnia magna TaxID=35525 RepID=A0A164WND4_9CRUS|nr:Lysosomal alpha-glucosidase [Daphnia magna]
MAPSASTKKKRAIFIGIGVTLMLVVIIVPISIELSQEKNEPRSTINNRIECFPFKNMTSDTCTKAGCLWEVVSGQPSCFLPDTSVYGYEELRVEHKDASVMDLTLKLKKSPRWIKFILGFFLLAIVVTAIVVPIVLTASDTEPTTPSPSTPTTTMATTFPPSVNYDRIECYPFSKRVCHSQIKLESLYLRRICILQIDGELMNLPDEAGFKIDIRRRRNEDDSIIFSLYGGDIDQVTFEVNYYSDSTLSFAFYPKNEDRFGLRPPVTVTPPTTGATEDIQYEVQLSSNEKGQPFNFQIIRKNSGAVIFDTSMGGLTIAEQFLMRDVNAYGAQPFYMASEEDGSSHGVFLFNSHAMDVTTMPNPGITFRAIGGMLEFFVFLGPQPESVVKQYGDVIGRTFMPPYFALGFQLSRWGYKNTSEIRDAIDRTRAVEIPHDIQYVDIDYMDKRRDFTIDPVNFADLPALVDEVKRDGLKFGIILDPAIAHELLGYPPFSRGDKDKVFVQWANSTYKPDGQAANDNNLYGRVWPRRETAFPDFFKNATKQWWTEEIRLFHKEQKLNFDLLWIDMNEPSNFLTGTLLKCPPNRWDDPPYETMAANVGATGRLSEKTICMASLFGEEDEFLHYEVHSLYGHSHAMATQSAVRQVLAGKRSMVLSRSTFAGSGKYAGHWLGDNYSTWKQMANSIIGMVEFNMFNIPYVGPDICGFNLNAEEEMCERWMELGAFYPFSRNHNSFLFKDQDPGQWPDTVAVSSRKALNIRYRLLPYLYTLFYDSHTVGGTVARPLYHEYPMDINARSIDKQFMWGPALLISPVLQPGETSVEVYLPKDVWYDYYTGIRITASGSNTFSAPRDYINLHLRGGYILPAQKPALNTMISRNNNFELLVPLDDNNYAIGKLFWDDGESVNTIEDGLYQINTFEFSGETLNIKVEKGSDDAWGGISQLLDTIQFMGWSSEPAKISVNGTDVETTLYEYNETSKNLFLFYKFSMNEDYVVEFR